MFFEVKAFFKFVEDCQRYGINVPIIPAIFPIQVGKLCQTQVIGFTCLVGEEAMYQFAESHTQLMDFCYVVQMPQIVSLTESITRASSNQQSILLFADCLLVLQQSILLHLVMLIQSNLNVIMNFQFLKKLWCCVGWRGQNKNLS